MVASCHSLCCLPSCCSVHWKINLFFLQDVINMFQNHVDLINSLLLYIFFQFDCRFYYWTKKLFMSWFQQKCNLCALLFLTAVLLNKLSFPKALQFFEWIYYLLISVSSLQHSKAFFLKVRTAQHWGGSSRHLIAIRSLVQTSAEAALC